MTKRIVFSIALLLVLCLALTGCGQRNNNPGANEANHEGETTIVDPGETTDPGTTSEPDDSTAPDDTDKTPSGEYDHDSSPAAVTLGDGKYSYRVWNIEIRLDTDIDDYIDGDVFRYTDLAYDLGWHVRNAEDKDNPNISRFFIDDDNKYSVGFSTLKTEETGKRRNYYAWVSFIKKSVNDYPSVNIGFNRNDLSGDGETYTVNKGGTVIASRSQVIILAYLFENHYDNKYEDPFAGILPRGVDTKYFIPE